MNELTRFLHPFAPFSLKQYVSPWIQQTEDMKDWFGEIERTLYHTPTEKDGVFTLEHEVPGFASEDLKLSYEKEQIRVTGEKGNRKVSFTNFVGKIDSDSIEASCKDGILTITWAPITKKEEKIQISIK